MIAETSTRKMGDIDIVEISGRLSLGNTLQSIERSILALIDGGSRKMVVHVKDLEFIDSAGVGMLIGASGSMVQNHGKLRVAGARGTVAHIFETVHLKRVAGVDPDLETACRGFEG